MKGFGRASPSCAAAATVQGLLGLPEGLCHAFLLSETEQHHEGQGWLWVLQTSGERRCQQTVSAAEEGANLLCLANDPHVDPFAAVSGQVRIHPGDELHYFYSVCLYASYRCIAASPPPLLPRCSGAAQQILPLLPHCCRCYVRSQPPCCQRAGPPFPPLH